MLASKNQRFVSLPFSIVTYSLCRQTKKKRASRRVPEQDDEDMAVDSKPVITPARDMDANFVDDDDLQAALSRSRQAKLRKTKKVSPEELARRGMYSSYPPAT